MLESLINSLDNKGVMAVQVLLGKRCIELLQKKPGLDNGSNALQPVSVI